MKRLKYLLLLLLIPFFVMAEECDVSNVTISSIEQSGINGKTKVISEPIFADRNVNLNLKMYEVGDSIDYDIIIKNDGEEDYMIDEDTFKTDSEYIEYSLKIDDNSNVVKAKSSKKVTLTVSYKKKVEDNLLNNNKYNASNNLKLSLNTNEKEKELDVITTDNIKSLVDMKNPKTNVMNLRVIIILLLTIIMMVIFIIFNKKKYNKYMLLILSFIIIPIVYAACIVDIKVESNIEIEKIANIEETIIALAEEDNSCISKYEGLVTDQVGQTVNATKVYINNCADKRVVIFGGFCWNIIRTTETGGVKMIYNGKAVDNKCEVGREKQPMIVQSDEFIDYSGSMLFGKNFDYDLDTGTFTLKDTEIINVSNSNKDQTLNKYTCMTTDETCSKIYFANYSDYGKLHFPISYSIANNYYSNIAFVSYNLPLTYSVYGSISTDSSHVNGQSIESIGYMYNKQYSFKYYNKPGNINYTFSDDIMYNHDTEIYTLTGSKKTVSNWADEYNQLGNKHYTCMNGLETCDTVAYVYRTTSGSMFYVDINDGSKNIVEILNEALNSEDVNTYDSSAKFFIEKWFEKNLLQYSSKIEDTVYCNDRVISDYLAFDVSTDIIARTYYYDKYLLFSHGVRKNDLKCSNLTDQFSLTNNKAKLTYPIALATGPEMNLLENNSLRKSESGYFMSYLMTGGFFDSDAYRIGYIYGSGEYNYHKVFDDRAGIRPVISLKKNNRIIGGTGSETDPWIIE